MSKEAKVGDMLIAKEEAYRNYSIPRSHKFYKVVEIDQNYSSIVSIQSEAVRLTGAIDLKNDFIKLEDEADSTVTKAVIGIISSGFKFESFEAKTVCGKTITLK